MTSYFNDLVKRAYSPKAEATVEKQKQKALTIEHATRSACSSDAVKSQRAKEYADSLPRLYS